MAAVQGPLPIQQPDFRHEIESSDFHQALESPAFSRNSEIISISKQMFDMLAECFKIARQMNHEEWVYIRDRAERDIMDAAEKTRQERVTQGWWSLGSGIASGSLKIISGVFGGLSAAKTSWKWAETTSRITQGLGDAGSAIGNGGSTLKAADVGKCESIYEQMKRRLETIEKLRQSSQSTEQMVVGTFDQIIQMIVKRSF